MKIPLKFQIYFWVHFVDDEILLQTNGNGCVSDKVLKYTSCFQSSISPKWVFFITFVSVVSARYRRVVSGEL